MNINQQLKHLKAQGLTPIPLENDLTLLPTTEQQKLFLDTLNSCNHLHFNIQIFPTHNQWPPKATAKITGLVLSLLSKELPTPTIVTLSRKEIHLFYNTHVISKTESNNLKDFIAKNLKNMESQYNLIIKSDSVSSVKGPISIIALDFNIQLPIPMVYYFPSTVCTLLRTLALTLFPMSLKALNAMHNVI